MNILLIDKRSRGQVLEGRLKTIPHIEVTYFQELSLDLDTTNYDAIFIHGSKKQSNADKFVNKNTTRPIIVYSGGKGSLEEFKEALTEEFIKKNEKNLWIFPKVIGNGDESYFKVEKFIKQWLKTNERPSFKILVGYSDRIKENMLKIIHLFLPLIIDIKGLTEVYTAAQNKVTDTLKKYLAAIFKGKKENYYCSRLLGVLSIVFDIHEIGDLKLSEELVEEIELKDSIQSTICESGMEEEPAIENLNILMEMKSETEPSNGNLYALFRHFDCLLEKNIKNGMDHIDKKDIQRLFELEKNIRMSIKNKTTAGIVSWFQELFTQLSQLAQNIDK